MEHLRESQRILQAAAEEVAEEREDNHEEQATGAWSVEYRIRARTTEGK